MLRSTKNQLDSEPGFTPGPGMDLIFSLLAVILVVLIIGSLLAKSEINWLRAQLRAAGIEDQRTDRFANKTAPKNVWEFSQDYIFEKNQAVLNDQGERILSQKAKEIRAMLGPSKANHIQVVGHASPEKVAYFAGQKTTVFDRNLDLSAMRSLAVAHFLSQHGIPYNCMSITGFGRGRSQHLQRWLTQGKGRTWQKWDDYEYYKSPYFEDQFKSERKVMIYAVFDQDSFCSLCR